MENKRFLVFGAPGSGKSTLIRYLPLVGHCTAIDLETVGGNADNGPEKAKRKSLMDELDRTNFNKPLFVAVADLDPSIDCPKSWPVIFLHHPDRTQYLAWAERRDMVYPEKRDQPYEHMHDCVLKYFNRVRPSLTFYPREFDNDYLGLAEAVWNAIDATQKFRLRSTPSQQSALFEK